MEQFYQGHRLQDTDLNTEFWSQSYFNPNGYSNPYSPCWIRYGLGYIHPDTGIYYEFGARYRLPIELRTGVFRPNFIIDEKAPTGTYEIRWKYRNFENSDIEFRKVHFQVISAGIYDQVGDFPDYVDLAGYFTVID